MKFNMKATICTSLLILAITAVTVLSVNIKTCHGLALYQILTGVIANLCIGDWIYKLYKWIAK